MTDPLHGLSPTTASALRCPWCRNPMVSESRGDTTVDRCVDCEGLWFDASELTKVLEVEYSLQDSVEQRIPHRGSGTRPCPRCQLGMDTTGWSGLVLDRCRQCRGLFVDARELRDLARNGTPLDPVSVEDLIRGAAWEAGWQLLSLKGLAFLLIRFLR